MNTSRRTRSMPTPNPSWRPKIYVRMHLSRFYIVRTAWLYARGGNNFPSKIVQAAEKYGKLRVVCDEISSPTYAPRPGASDRRADPHRAIWHLSPDQRGRVFRLEFARRILELAGKGDVPLEPITSDQWPRASTPPLHCVIRNLAGAQIGITLAALGRRAEGLLCLARAPRARRALGRSSPTGTARTTCRPAWTPCDGRRTPTLKRSWSTMARPTTRSNCWPKTIQRSTSSRCPAIAAMPGAARPG